MITLEKSEPVNENRDVEADGDEDNRKRPVGWREGGGSPIQAWFFFIGFILFPLWYLASLSPVPRTRRLGGDGRLVDEELDTRNVRDIEKSGGGGDGGGSTVWLDDPQVECDARRWRFRCRVMAGVSVLTYIPFIILVAIFASK